MLLVPITLGYLGVQEYGVWILLTTIVGWFVFFDIGLGHGLRNKYAESKAKNNLEDTKKYVSTTFFILCIISSIIFLLFLLVSFFVDWSIVLNAPASSSSDLGVLAIIVVAMFCVRFVVSIIKTLLTADQDPSVPELISLIGQLGALGLVYLITRTTETSILYIGIALTVTQLLPLVIAFFYLFASRYKAVLPSIKYFSRDHMQSVFSLGIRFFFVQLTTLVIFQSNNIIIAHVCSIEGVTEFNIAYKYINLLLIGFTTVLTPLWSASTEAYALGDLKWIRNSMKRLNQLWILLILGGVLLISISPLIYRIWLKGTLVPDFQLLILLLVYIIFLSRSSMYRFFINGVGKITLQFYVTLIQSCIHIPLTIVLGKLYGLSGIVFVMILWAAINSVWEQIQYSRIINESASGIWNR